MNFSIKTMTVFALIGRISLLLVMPAKAASERPTRQSLTTQANAQLEAGNESGWLETMESILDLPFDRDTDADTNSKIATHFIEKGEWEKALPYQEAAALRGSYQALAQAAWLNGALGHTQRGMEWVQQDLFFNKNNRISSYIMAFNALPTKQTTELIDVYYTKHSTGNATDRARCASIALIRTDYDDAAALLEQSFQIGNDPWYGVYAALICDEQGWSERRDKILKETVKRWPNYRNKNKNRRDVRTFIDLFIEANQAGEITPDLKQQLQQLLATCGSTRNDFTRAFAGELYRLKGEPELARTVHQEVISVYHQRLISEHMSYRGLRLLGGDPVDILNNRRLKNSSTEEQP